MKSVEPINPFCWILLLPIKVYQFTLGAIMPRVCRFQPTCSFYAYEAISVHGIFKGGWLAFKRILKCNPLNPGGFDPVPPRLEGN